MNTNTLSVSTTSSIRPPLKETSGNVPSPALKKIRLAKINPSHNTNSTSASGSKASRLVGNEMRQWQNLWRKIMKESVVYFDPHGQDDSNYNQKKEKQKAKLYLEQLGCNVIEFWNYDVTIIVSRRTYSPNENHNTSDIFNHASKNNIKVWNYDKVFRFLKNLGESTSTHNQNSKNLSNLLKEEKYLGPTDRDPLAKRDDFHFLKTNSYYFFVYDLTQRTRPIAVREWPGKDYPAFHSSTDGRCPFTLDPSCDMEKRKARRQSRFESSRESRMKLIQVSTINPKSVLPLKRSSDDSESENNPNPNGNHRAANKMAPPSLARHSSSTFPLFQSNSNSKFYEVQASGFNASNAASGTYSTDSSNVANGIGNGLAPTISQVQSKLVTSLKRKIFIKRKQIQHQKELLKLQKIDEDEKQAHIAKPHETKDEKPGYCENCRNKYDDFDNHILTSRHRNFALNDANFSDIDALIARLNHDKTMGYVSSS